MCFFCLFLWWGYLHQHRLLILYVLTCIPILLICIRSLALWFTFFCLFVVFSHVCSFSALLSKSFGMCMRESERVRQDKHTINVLLFYCGFYFMASIRNIAHRIGVHARQHCYSTAFMLASAFVAILSVQSKVVIFLQCHLPFPMEFLYDQYFDFNSMLANLKARFTSCWLSKDFCEILLGNWVECLKYNSIKYKRFSINFNQILFCHLNG